MLREVSHHPFLCEKTVHIDGENHNNFKGVIQNFGGSYHFYVNRRKRTIIWKVTGGHFLSLCEICGDKRKTIRLRFRSVVLSFVYFEKRGRDVFIHCLAPPVYHVFTLSLPKDSVGSEEQYSYLTSIANATAFHHIKKTIPNCENATKFIFLGSVSFAFISKDDEESVHIVKFNNPRLEGVSVNKLSHMSYLGSFFRWNAIGERYIDIHFENASPFQFLFVLTDHLNLKIFELKSGKYLTSFSFTLPNAKDITPSPGRIRFCHQPLECIISGSGLIFVCYYYDSDTDGAAFRYLRIQWDGTGFSAKSYRPLSITRDNRTLIDYKLSRDDQSRLVSLWRRESNEDDNLGFPYYDINVGFLFGDSGGEPEWVRVSTLWDDLRREMECKPEIEDLIMLKYPDIISSTLEVHYGASPHVTTFSTFEIRERVSEYISKMAEQRYPNRTTLTEDEIKRARKEEERKFWKHCVSKWMEEHIPFAVFHSSLIPDSMNEAIQEMRKRNVVAEDVSDSDLRTLFRAQFGVISTRDFRILRKTDNFCEIAYKNSLSRQERLEFVKGMISRNDGNCVNKAFKELEYFDDDVRVKRASLDTLKFLECVGIFSGMLGAETMLQFDHQLSIFCGGKNSEMLQGALSPIIEKLRLDKDDKRVKYGICKRLNEISATSSIPEILRILLFLTTYMWDVPKYTQIMDTTKRMAETGATEHMVEITELQNALNESTHQISRKSYGFVRDLFLFYHFMFAQRKMIFQKKSGPKETDLFTAISRLSPFLSCYFRSKWLIAQPFSDDIYMLPNLRKQVEDCVDILYFEELLRNTKYLAQASLTRASHHLSSLTMFCRPTAYGLGMEEGEMEFLKMLLFRLLKLNQVEVLQQYCRMFSILEYPFFNHFLGVSYAHQKKYENAVECFKKVAMNLPSQAPSESNEPKNKKKMEDEDENEEEGEGEEIMTQNMQNQVKVPKWTNLFIPPTKKPTKFRICTRFDYFFFLVTSVFPDIPELVLSLGELGMAEARTPLPTGPSLKNMYLLNSKLFAGSLCMGRFHDAMKHVIMMPEESEEQDNSLSVLLTHMLEEGRTKLIVEGWSPSTQYISVPWTEKGEASLPSPKIGHALWRKARQCEVLAKFGKTRIYNILFSFFFHRKQYDVASRFMYEFSTRIKKEVLIPTQSTRLRRNLMEDEESSSNNSATTMERINAQLMEELERQRMISVLQLRSSVLSTCINSLLICPDDARYFLYRHSSNDSNIESSKKKKEKKKKMVDEEEEEEEVGEESEESEDEVFCQQTIITIEDLQKEYVLNNVYLTLLQHKNVKVSELFGTHERSTLLELLGGMKYSNDGSERKSLFDLGFTFGKLFGVDKKFVFRYISRHCIKVLKDEDQIILDLEVQKILVRYLKMYEEKQHFIEVMETILSLGSVEIKRSQMVLKIPLFVHDWMERNAPSEMLGIFLKYRLVAEGCDLVDGYVRRVEEEEENVPYLSRNFLDRLFFMMRKHVTAEEEQIREFQKKVMDVLG